LGHEDWALPLYEADPIEKNTTTLDLQRLRFVLTDEALENLRDHLGATYAKFLIDDRVKIIFNGEPVKSKFFENWAYPPGYEPRRYSGQVKADNGKFVRVEATAGLSDESSPAAGEYGVYFYCNDRLIVRALKSLDVGFMRGFAGLPHPKISLAKVIISLNGDAKSMPWNSSKSDISTKHEVFQALQRWLMETMKDFAALSRIWMGDWQDKVFSHTEGSIVEVEVADFPTAKKSFLPPMPKSRPRFGDVLADKNRNIVKKKPWAKGLYEGIVAADLISKQNLEQANRIALIVLDSTLEISFKEFLVRDSGHYYSDSQISGIFQTKHKVITEIKKYISVDDDTWKKVSHYSDLRNKFVHQRATASVSDDEVADFREVVEKFLKKLFKLRF
jgi:hypothetical protein